MFSPSTTTGKREEASDDASPQLEQGGARQGKRQRVEGEEEGGEDEREEEEEMEDESVEDIEEKAEEEEVEKTLLHAAKEVRGVVRCVLGLVFRAYHVLGP